MLESGPTDAPDLVTVGKIDGQDPVALGSTFWIGQYDWTIFSYKVNEGLRLDAINDGQHEHYLKNRRTYRTSDLAMDMPTRFSIPKGELPSEFDIERQSIDRFKQPRPNGQSMCFYHFLGH